MIASAGIVAAGAICAASMPARGMAAPQQSAESRIDAGHSSAIVLPMAPHVPQPPQSGEARPPYEDRFAAVDGLRLHYLDWGGSTLPRGEIVTMPGLGHYLDSEDPAGFLEIVNRFLKRSL